MKKKTMRTIITGGASGIGLATAKLLHTRGASICVIDLKAEDEFFSNERVFFIAANLANPDEAAAAVKSAANKMQGVNALVNNAGIQRYGKADETSIELWNEVLAINLTAAFTMSKACIPHFRQAGGGAIVNVSSVQAHGAQQGAVAYVTSKHALLGLSRALAVDHAAEGIRTNCVCPGSVDTPMWRWSVSLDPNPNSVIEACEAMHPMGRVAQPHEIAEVIAFLLSDQASFMNGESVNVDGGLWALIGGAPKKKE